MTHDYNIDDFENNLISNKLGCFGPPFINTLFQTSGKGSGLNTKWSIPHYRDFFHAQAIWTKRWNKKCGLLAWTVKVLADQDQNPAKKLSNLNFAFIFILDRVLTYSQFKNVSSLNNNFASVCLPNLWNQFLSLDSSHVP